MISLIICALFVWGVGTVVGTAFPTLFNCTSEEWVYTQPRWLQLVLTPVIGCVICMSSVWGTVYYFLIAGGTDVGQWILHCVVSAGLVAIIVKAWEIIEALLE